MNRREFDEVPRQPIPSLREVRRGKKGLPASWHERANLSVDEVLGIVPEDFEQEQEGGVSE